MNKNKIKYDAEEDILVLSKGNKVKSSEDIGDFIIDIDHDRFITGIEILDASTTLGIDAEQLKNLKTASMKVTYKPDHALILLVLGFAHKEKDISIPLTLSLGHSSTKTESAKFAA